MHELFLDPQCGLLHQAKNASIPGVISQDHWSRGNGWAIIALTELVNALPKDSPLRAPGVKMFKDLLQAALRVQDANGMWRQEMTLIEPPSFVETSGTGMLLYALGIAVQQGLAEDGWRDALLRGLRGYLSYIALDGSVHNTCEGCCSPEDGSIAAYCRKAHPLNDPHAHGPAVLAFAQAHQIGMTEI
jgi:unsaturated rhamnogalacturonyl hydrolase